MESRYIGPGGPGPQRWRGGLELGLSHTKMSKQGSARKLLTKSFSQAGDGYIVSNDPGSWPRSPDGRTKAGRAVFLRHAYCHQVSRLTLEGFFSDVPLFSMTQVQDTASPPPIGAYGSYQNAARFVPRTQCVPLLSGGTNCSLRNLCRATRERPGLSGTSALPSWGLKNSSGYSRASALPPTPGVTGSNTWRAAPGPQHGGSDPPFQWAFHRLGLHQAPRRSRGPTVPGSGPRC